MMHYYIMLNIAGNMIRTSGVTVEKILAKEGNLPLYK